MTFVIPSGMWEPQTPCGHIRHKVGFGEDGATLVDVWRCDECGDDLLAVASAEKTIICREEEQA